MEKLLPNISETNPHYVVLQVNTPKLTPSVNTVLYEECIKTLIDIPSCWTNSNDLSVNVRLNNMDDYPRSVDTSDLDAVYVKECDLKDITQVRLCIGGVYIVSLTKHMINDFCDRIELNNETYINLFSKFIDKIPLKSCYYHTVYVCFEYDMFSTGISTERRRVFKYCRYDYDTYDKIFDNPTAYDEVDVMVYQGDTPNIKLLPSKKLCEELNSCLEKVTIIEPYNLGRSRYILFEPQNNVPDIVVSIDEASFTIPKNDLYFLENSKLLMWSVPYDEKHGFVKVQGDILTSTIPIKYALLANTLQVRQGLAGIYFAS